MTPTLRIEVLLLVQNVGLNASTRKVQIFFIDVTCTVKIYFEVIPGTCSVLWCWDLLRFKVYINCCIIPEIRLPQKCSFYCTDLLSKDLFLWMSIIIFLLYCSVKLIYFFFSFFKKFKPDLTWVFSETLHNVILGLFATP